MTNEGESFTPIQTIRDVADLRRLASSRLGLMPRRGAISLQVEGLHAGEATDLEARLIRYRAACGCEAGTVSLLLVGFGYPLYAFFSEGLSQVFTVSHLAMWVVASAAGAVVGKMLGLTIARLRYRRLVLELIERLEKTMSSR